ncbi:uncharacterized protein LOC126789945 [Argentina anserina]|uniref:uncharacterized protein LOC126789945 n=1 Tax=Argentina anserina TaxID=57926 RepID=UPI0021768886|nr:uncharacterized protein LOC126789945 [Potentilla anserina]
MEASEEQYAEFEEKVKRTVYLDNLSPQVNESIVKQALDQFGNVKSVQFIPNYLGSKNMQQCALIEMENQTQVNAVVSDITEQPFMIGGMPRPVRARKAKMEMFDDRPVKPGRTIEVRWVEPDEPDFEVAKKLKELAKFHAADTEFLLKEQLEDEEKLEKQQQESLKVTHKKYKTVDGVLADGTLKQLGRGYHLPVGDD